MLLIPGHSNQHPSYPLFGSSIGGQATPDFRLAACAGKGGVAARRVAGAPYVSRGTPSVA